MEYLDSHSEARKRGKSWSGVVVAGITIRSEPKWKWRRLYGNRAKKPAAGSEFDLTNTGALEVTELPIENQFNFSQCGR